MDATAPRPAGERRRSRKAVRWGAGLAVAAFLVPFLWLASLVLGIVVMGRGRVRIGGAIVVASLAAWIANTAWLQAVVVKPYRVPSEGMSPTLEAGDRILVNRLADVGAGDVVAFAAPEGAVTRECGEQPPEGAMCARAKGGSSQVTFVKRIVAGPGDSIALRGGRLIRNGRPVDEPYVGACDEPSMCDFPRPVTVPPGHWFVLGDRRDASDDSRFWGPVAQDTVIGKLWITYFHGS